MSAFVGMQTLNQKLKQEIIQGIQAVRDSGCYVFGEHMAAFEKEAAEYLGSRYAISCGSGTDALWLSLRALDIGAGDEVITTPFNAHSAIEAICMTGARPVFVDIQPDTFNMDPEKVEEAITPATRALLPCHQGGHPAQIDLLKAMTQHHDLALVEDCSQSFGALYGSVHTGCFGEAGCFSFTPQSHFGAPGGGGLITTQSDAMARKLRALSNHGIHKRHYHALTGIRSHLDEFQAVTLRARLKYLDHFTRARHYWVNSYNACLEDLSGVILPKTSHGCTPVYSQYTLLLEQRDRVHKLLQTRGIESRIPCNEPLYRQPSLVRDYAGLFLPIAEAVTAHCLSLPVSPLLKANEVSNTIAFLRSTPGAPHDWSQEGWRHYKEA